MCVLRGGVDSQGVLMSPGIRGCVESVCLRKRKVFFCVCFERGG